MRTTLADYAVLGPRRFELTGERSAAMLGEPPWYNSESIRFTASAELATSGGDRRPVLSFFADPSANAEDINLRISLNTQYGEVGERGRDIFTYHYRDGVGRHHFVVFDHGILRPGADNNYLAFTRWFQPDNPSSRGVIYISDVVLWFQRWVDVTMGPF